MKYLNAKTLSLGLLCGLAIVGCNKKDKQAEATPETAPEAVVVVDANPNCDDASIKNSLIQELSKQMAGDVETIVADYPNATEIDLVRRTQQRLGDLGVDLQNVRAEGDTCHADIIVTLPVVDVNYADRYFKAQGLPSIAELATEKSLNFADNRLSSAISYQVANGGVSINKPDILSLIAQTISASAYNMAQDENNVNTTGRPAIKIRPLAPSEIARPSATPRPDVASTTTTPATTTTSESSSSSTTTPESQDPLVAEFAEKQKAEKAELATAPTATPTDKAPAKAEPKDSAPTSSKPVEGDAEITIVESDETY